MKLNIENLGSIIALIICIFVLAKANDIILKYIAFAGIIYILSKDSDKEVNMNEDELENKQEAYEESIKIQRENQMFKKFISNLKSDLERNFSKNWGKEDINWVDGALFETQEILEAIRKLEKELGNVIL